MPTRRGTQVSIKYLHPKPQTRGSNQRSAARLYTAYPPWLLRSLRLPKNISHELVRCDVPRLPPLYRTSSHLIHSEGYKYAQCTVPRRSAVRIVAATVAIIRLRQRGETTCLLRSKALRSVQQREHVTLSVRDGGWIWQPTRILSFSSCADTRAKYAGQNKARHYVRCPECRLFSFPFSLASRSRPLLAQRSSPIVAIRAKRAVAPLSGRSPRHPCNAAPVRPMPTAKRVRTGNEATKKRTGGQRTRSALPCVRAFPTLRRSGCFSSTATPGEALSSLH